MRTIFHKLSGIILSTSLVFTGLSFTGISKSFAEESDSSSTSTSEGSSEEAVYANIESIEIVGEGYDYAAIEITLDIPLEEADMPIFIYEKDNPEAIQEISEGPRWVYFEIPKTSSPQYIYATTGSSTSDIVIIDPIPEIETFEISADKTVLKKQRVQSKN